ncbi:hypothetical protein [Endozoicomonas sp. 8E]|uniref:hypothetical protein n=1 Tax=Endozoicomonas sp. 8E TaxID=3035692 RepID=UPI0029393082|nr:hypothetical protein [Endozoicomonas sp. 8E]WOG28998.1 hypothetical protein P6910_04865 [Endozoicomonas sp. 8E]
MDRLRALLLTILIFFPVQAFAGEFSPNYPSAYRQFPELATALDKDSDGLLSYDELIDGYHAPYLNKDLYQTIRLYLVNFESWQNPFTVSLNRESIELAELSGQVAKYHHEQDNTFWDAWLAKPERQPFADAYRRLFPHGLTSITPDSLLQMHFPDCVLIASLASIASSETGKRRIFNYFYAFDEQRFGIFFPGLPSGKVIQFSEVERYSHFAKTRDEGMWLAMLEAAYAHLSKIFLNKNQHNDRARFQYHQYSELYGVPEGHALSILTSSYIDYIYPQLKTHEQIRELLNSLVNDEKAATVSVTVTSKPEILNHLGLRPFSRIKSKHAYSLIGYDKEKDVVYVRDPHGWSAAAVNIYTINRHIQTLYSGNSEIFEVIKNLPRDPEYKLAYGLTEPRLYHVLNQTLPKAMMDIIIAKGIIPSDISLPIFTSERSPARTGIIAMTVEQFIDTFNALFISQCGPYQRPTKNN